jgi:hypothetical protein
MVRARTLFLGLVGGTGASFPSPVGGTGASFPSPVEGTGAYFPSPVEDTGASFPSPVEGTGASFPSPVEGTGASCSSLSLGIVAESVFLYIITYFIDISMDFFTPIYKCALRVQMKYYEVESLLCTFQYLHLYFK